MQTGLSPQRRKHLDRFIDTGEADAELLDFIGRTPEAADYCERVMRTDHIGRLLTEALKEQP